MVTVPYTVELVSLPCVMIGFFCTRATSSLQLL